jgi:hypothetical protein
MEDLQELKVKLNIHVDNERLQKREDELRKSENDSLANKSDVFKNNARRDHVSKN